MQIYFITLVSLALMINESWQQTASATNLICYKGTTYSSGGVVTYKTNPVPSACNSGGFCTTEIITSGNSIVTNYGCSSATTCPTSTNNNGALTCCSTSFCNTATLLSCVVGKTSLHTGFLYQLVNPVAQTCLYNFCKTEIASMGLSVITSYSCSDAVCSVNTGNYLCDTCQTTNCNRNDASQRLFLNVNIMMMMMVAALYFTSSFILF